MFSMNGERALVIGGTSGIGLGAARAFVAAGADVTVASRSERKVADAAAQIGARGVVLDASSDSEVEAFFAAEAAWHHIVVSVTVATKGTVRGSDMELAMQAMNAKFWSAYRVARSAKIESSGSLTIVTGQVGLRPRGDAVLLAGINAGLEGFARGLAVELSPVRVNAIAPGITDTPQHDIFPSDKRKALYESEIARLPARRIGTEEDLGEAILFLATNRFSTGSTLRVDGGSTIV